MQNGRLPDSALSAIPGGRLAKGGPARSWLAMRFYIGKKTGIWVKPTGGASSYRPYGKQVEFYKAYLQGRGPLAARPGTSNHGWGKAVDVPRPAMADTIRRYGPRFGWFNGPLSDAPSEWWHCTFRGGNSARVAYWLARYRLARRHK